MNLKNILMAALCLALLTSCVVDNQTTASSEQRVSTQSPTVLVNSTKFGSNILREVDCETRSVLFQSNSSLFVVPASPANDGIMQYINKVCGWK